MIVRPILKPVFAYFFILLTFPLYVSGEVTPEQLKKLVSFQIHPSAAADSLKLFAEQSGLAILFPHDLVASSHTNNLTGDYSIQDGLNLLLWQTGLEGSVSAKGTIFIKVKEPDSTPEPEPSVIRESTMKNTQPKFKEKKIARGIIASLLAASSATAVAQENTDVEGSEESASEERITVVGSRIAGAYVGEALPVSVIGVDEIEAIGAVSGDELFRSIPQFGDVSFNQTSGQTSSNFARGDVGSVDLRNLGVGSTLVLINGRRGVNYPSSQASGTLAPVLTFNANTIPTNGIKRVEILRDGAEIGRAHV